MTRKFNLSVPEYPILQFLLIGFSSIEDKHTINSMHIIYELGIDIRFFNNRLVVDATVYMRNTYDDIVSAQISSCSGFKNVLINAGKIVHITDQMNIFVIAISRTGLLATKVAPHSSIRKKVNRSASSKDLLS